MSIINELKNATRNGNVVTQTADSQIGIELPPVTAADNGKILGVDNGTWDKVAAPSGLPSVTAADNGSSLGVIDGEWGVMPNPMGKIKYVELLETDDGYETVETAGELFQAQRDGFYLFTANNGLEAGNIFIYEVAPADSGKFFAELNYPPSVSRDGTAIKLIANSYITDTTLSNTTFLFSWDSEVEGEFLPSTASTT